MPFFLSRNEPGGPAPPGPIAFYLMHRNIE